MPVLINKPMDSLKTSSNYKFSATKIDELGATEYTLVTIAQDASGSVLSYAREMENCLKTILSVCKKSPRAENLLYRLIAFNSTVDEIHGFKLLNTIKDDDYDNILQPTGGTALFDATQSAIEATTDYAKILNDQEFSVNAIVFIVTDGDNNVGSATANTVKKAIEKAKKAEVLEQLTVVLVGVGGANINIAEYLTRFQSDAGITQFVDMGDATPSVLAKLANFVSKSISSHSQALNNGTSSNLLTF